MDITKFASELPYPEIIPVENLHDAKLLMPNYGGAAGELTAILTYSYQAYISWQDESLNYILEHIGIAEMHHHEMLGEAIYKLGGYPIMAGRNYWNGSYVDYTVDPIRFIEKNIAGEELAILNYERTILNLQEEQVKLLIERIILDEELHIKIFKELLCELKNPK
ncbi:MAG: manganese catalase family protein [Clostridia bacterium]|nr:manganese catalase family protein [Clostridia bacterium]